VLDLAVFVTYLTLPIKQLDEVVTTGTCLVKFSIRAIRAIRCQASKLRPVTPQKQGCVQAVAGYVARCAGFCTTEGSSISDLNSDIRGGEITVTLL